MQNITPKSVQPRLSLSLLDTKAVLCGINAGRLEMSLAEKNNNLSKYY